MRNYLITCFLLLAFTSALSAQSPLQGQLDAALRSAAALRGAAVGVSVRDGQGRVLASVNEDTRLVPASNMKLITTGAALHAFGADHRFPTRIGYTGTVQDGVLQGDVYLIGGGDPTLGTRDSIARSADAVFGAWKDLLLRAGIRSIAGRIIGDGRAYEGHLEHPSWSYDDTGTSYGTGCNALSFYANAVDMAVTATAPGKAVQVRQTWPETPWMHLSNLAVTGPPGTGNSLYLYTTDLAPYAELRGTFAQGRPPRTEHFANKYGALTCAYYFCRYLQAQGWTVRDGYADIDRSGEVRGADFLPSGPARTPQPVGETLSPPLSRIARATNVRSDNFYAESLFRAMGEAATGVAVYDSCAVAEREVLQSLHLSLEGLHIADGSGLSRHNYVSPRFLTDFLLAMQQSPAFGAFMASLPTPGEGTVRVLLRGADPALRRRLHLKSGSMDGVLCYAGYLTDEEGVPLRVFSFMVNQATAPVPVLRQALEALLETLFLSAGV